MGRWLFKPSKDLSGKELLWLCGLWVFSGLTLWTSPWPERLFTFWISRGDRMDALLSAAVVAVSYVGEGIVAIGTALGAVLCSRLGATEPESARTLVRLHLGPLRLGAVAGFLMALGVMINVLICPNIMWIGGLMCGRMILAAFVALWSVCNGIDYSLRRVTATLPSTLGMAIPLALLIAGIVAAVKILDLVEVMVGYYF